MRLAKLIIHIFLFFNILFSKDTLKIDYRDFEPIDIIEKDSDKVLFSIDSFQEIEEDIFDAQMSEAKSIFAEAIISDLTGDTLEATYQFDLLFDALANIEDLSKNDEFQTLEFNRILTAAISDYEK